MSRGLPTRVATAGYGGETTDMALNTVWSRIKDTFKTSRLGKAKKELEMWYAEHSEGPTGEQKVAIAALRESFEKESNDLFNDYEERKNALVCTTIEAETRILKG